MNFFQWLMDWWEAARPLVLIRSYERGVLWIWGRNPRELGPGPRFQLRPWRDIEVVNTAEEYVSLPVQSVITKDNKLVCFRAAFGFIVVDPVKHFCNVEDFHEATVELAMMHLAERVRDQELNDSLDLKRLEKSLEGTLTTRLKEWGSEITRVGFTDFAIVPRQYRIFGGLPTSD
jgi:regulator of protease activity HflC (stomatin/prohibitin superfamily)